MSKLERFFAGPELPSPCLAVDLDIVESNYRLLRESFARTAIYYAVKANPAEAVIKRLKALGSLFDVASLSEVELCLSLGVAPQHISWGNPIKKESDIGVAFARGVDMYAFDSHEELEKLAQCAPGSRVSCRLHIDEGTDSAVCPLSAKFGCSPITAEELMVRARELGLVPHGLSFHLGSQQTDVESWEQAIAVCAGVFRRLRDKGIDMELLNLGGGFAVRYSHDVPRAQAYAECVHTSMRRHFGNHMPTQCIEPGRSLVASAGWLRSEVLLIADRRDRAGGHKWVYLDSGRSSGLVETVNDRIVYPLYIPNHEDSAMEDVMLAGPTCDWSDIINDGVLRQVPTTLKSGDHVFFTHTGAYTTTCSSVGFNGFAPLESFYI
ncbi:MAG: type III PLP-dependent enzyme [Alphaproteobacteria bacterium GM202ARS2]|nr:type III PLP-dependent enzyme [Alphaproteobacteria bacterium GM202ARS2]